MAAEPMPIRPPVTPSPYNHVEESHDGWLKKGRMEWVTSAYRSWTGSMQVS